MNNSFYTPTRQATIGIVANFLNTSQKLVRGFAPLLLIIFVNKKMDVSVSIWGMVLLGCVIAMAIAYLSYRNFLFYIDEQINSFVIQKGIINKSKVTIQLDKIQQVNLNQNFINRLINVYSVEIDSAGSKDKEATIPSMALVDANILKQILLDYKKEFSNINVSLDDGVPVLENEQIQEAKRISISTLLKVGVTSNYLYTLGAIMLFFNMLYESLAKSFSVENYVNTEEVTAYVERGVPTLVLFWLILLIVITVLIVNIVRTFLKFWDFKAVLSRGTLMLSQGLISTRNTIIRPERVQKIEVEQNYFQKLFDICALKISQVAGEDSENKKSGLQIPGCSFEEKEALLSLLMAPQNADYHTVLKYNYRYLGFRLFLLIGIPVAIFTLVFRTEFALNTFLIITCSYTIVMTLALYRLYKVGRLYVSDSFIVVCKGIWDVSHIYLEPHKIQKIVLLQLWWQESADVGSMRIYTAGGIVSFSTTQYSELVRLRDEWLYRVESTNLQWM